MQARQFAESFFNKFTRDETTTLAASLAFYTALSLAPLLVLFVTIASQFSNELQHEFTSQVRTMVSQQAATVVEVVIDGAQKRPDLTSVASIFGLLTLMLSASLIFGELRSALNRIFEVRIPEATQTGALGMVFNLVKDRVLHIGLALGFIFILIISLVASSVISANVYSHLRWVAMLINIVVSFSFYTFLFTMTFRFMPNHRQPWRQALQGGALTALLFVVGKEFIGFYLGQSAVGSAYGAAGSVIALLVWVYYSTLITFIGAQVSALLSSTTQETPA